MVVPRDEQTNRTGVIEEQIMSELINYYLFLTLFSIKKKPKNNNCMWFHWECPFLSSHVYCCNVVVICTLLALPLSQKNIFNVEEDFKLLNKGCDIQVVQFRLRLAAVIQKWKIQRRNHSIENSLRLEDTLRCFAQKLSVLWELERPPVSAEAAVAKVFD